jgi:hypothetical protein|tara:strand:- start:812 stop:919 length:108 start_codon:yes stop_codon:yes gene_type:complete
MIEKFHFTQERWDNLNPDIQKVLEDNPNVEVIING